MLLRTHQFELIGREEGGCLPAVAKEWTPWGQCSDHFEQWDKHS